MSNSSGTAPLPEPPRVGGALQALRQAQSLTLDDLSRKAGVSKSMLSQIERNHTNPTVAVVWRLANALGIGVAELLGSGRPEPAPILTIPAHGTPALKSPDGKYELRILGPIDLAGQFEWYELTVQSGGALESDPHEPGAREHLSVLSGALEVSVGQNRSRLKAGETARYAGDQPHAIRNLGRSQATAVLVVLHR